MTLAHELTYGVQQGAAASMAGANPLAPARSSHSSVICSLNKGATLVENPQLKQHLGPEVFELEPALGELLRFSNSMEIGTYQFYKASGEGIDTIEFKTIFLWELNRHWEHRMYLFMGDGELLLDIGVVSAFLGQSCIGAIIDSGYEQDEVVPIASSLDVFCSCFWLSVRRLLLATRGGTGSFPSCQPGLPIVPGGMLAILRWPGAWLRPVWNVCGPKPAVTRSSSFKVQRLFWEMRAECDHWRLGEG